MQGSASPLPSWIVVLEFSAAEHPGSQPTIGQVVELLQSLDPPAPVSLYDVDRYAVQVEVAGASAGRALDDALARHPRSVARLGLAPLPLVRADVMTPAELARDLDAVAAHTPATWTVATYGQN